MDLISRCLERDSELLITLGSMERTANDDKCGLDVGSHFSRRWSEEEEDDADDDA